MKPSHHGFHHVAFRVKDYDRVVAFYTEGLGFTKGITWGEDDGRAIMIDIGNDNFLEVFADGEYANDKDGAYLHVALRSTDCDGDLDRAVRAGAVVTMHPSDIDVPSEPVKKIRIAFCKGLNGEIIEFFEEK
jgi:glyoxylase I family protein